ncbi:MAG: hypothetical protein CME69_00350 [Halobacteriovorax sp.]|nr:hypothetical protein [Halobacteriovorax sp.]
MFKFLIVPLSLYSLLSCSSFNFEDEKVVHQKEKLKIEKAELISGIQLVEQNLNVATKEAILKGDSARDYLASDLFLKANDASLNGNTDLSSLLFKYIIKLKPKDIFIRKKYAVELIKSNRIEKAKHELDYLIKHGDSDLKEKAKLLLAGVYAALSKKEESKKLYLEIVNSKSDKKFEACIFLSKAYAKEKKIKKSFNILNKCSRSDKENKASYVYYKGRVEFDREKPKRAIKHLKEALKLDKEHYQSALLLGHIYETTEKEGRAIVLYKKFLNDDPMNYAILNRYVNLLFVNNELEEAVPYLERLIEIDPTNLNLKVRLGVIYTEMNNLAGAKSIFKEVLDSVPESDKVLYYLASLYQHSEENESAIEYYSKISSESPLFYDSNLQVARILNVMALKDNLIGKSEGEKRLFSFVKKDHESSQLSLELKVVLAEYYESSNRPKDAIRVLEKLSQSDDFSKSHKYRLAILYEQTKDYESSDKIMLNMIKKNPENADALNFLGYSMLERGDDIESAYKYIEKAIKLKPHDSTIRDSLGWYYYKKGEYKKAYKEIKAAWQDLRDDLVVTKHLALVYKALKKYDKAKEFYVEALRNVDSVTDREELLKELESIETLRLPASN